MRASLRRKYIINTTTRMIKSLKWPREVRLKHYNNAFRGVIAFDPQHIKKTSKSFRLPPKINSWYWKHSFIIFSSHHDRQMSMLPRQFGQNRICCFYRVIYGIFGVVLRILFACRAHDDDLILYFPRENNNSKVRIIDKNKQNLRLIIDERSRCAWECLSV
jgi:hypothetical protein